MPIYKRLMDEVRCGADFPGIEVSISILQCKFPPFSVKSVHLSVKVHNILAGNLSNSQQGKSQDVMNLAQQLNSDWLPVELASPETPPSAHASSFQKSLRLPYPLSLVSGGRKREDSDQEDITTCWEVEGSFWAACLASTSDRHLPDASCEPLGRRALAAMGPLLVAHCGAFLDRS